MRMFETIRSDERHQDVSIVAAGSRPARAFHGWAMAYAETPAVLPSEITGILESPELIPIHDAAEKIIPFMKRHVEELGR